MIIQTSPFHATVAFDFVTESYDFRTRYSLGIGIEIIGARKSDCWVKLKVNTAPAGRKKRLGFRVVKLAWSLSPVFKSQHHP
jgi:hypothetical protein